MRLEYIIVAIILFLVVLAAGLGILGDTVPEYLKFIRDIPNRTS